MWKKARRGAHFRGLVKHEPQDKMELINCADRKSCSCIMETYYFRGLSLFGQCQFGLT